jgi:hypothetical protein
LTGAGAFVVDHTALAALGRGNWFMSRLVVKAADSESGNYVFAPALCLAAATAERPAMADHIGGLRAVDIVDLGFPSAAAVGHLVAEGVDWRIAQAIDAARPTVDWPGGRPVVTAEPDAYAKWGIDVIELNR